MAAKTKKSRGRRKSAKPMQVVSLKSVLHLLRSAEHRIEARRMPRRRRNPDSLDTFEDMEENPIRHFPKMKGRGRPPKMRKWTVAMKLADGSVREKSFRATKELAYARAQRRIAQGTYDGKKVVEVVVDDGR